MSGLLVDCLADTSAIIGLSRRDPKTIATVGRRDFGISFVTVAELAVGFRRASQRETATERLHAVLSSRRGRILYPSSDTPLLYAEICYDLEKREIRIPSNDIWIAAIAVEHNLPLIGRDEHFTRVTGLKFIPC